MTRDNVGRNRGAAPARTSTWMDAGWIFLLLCVVAALQHALPYPYDTDTAYHFVVGRLIAEHGILHAFPWTPFSWLAEHYADKELIFHLLFVPFSGLDYASASRAVGTIAGGAVVVTFYCLLRAESVRFPGIWSLLLPVASSTFLFRFLLVRPHLLSIPLALLLLWALARQRMWIILLVCALYPWTYVAFWQVPLLLLIAVQGGWLLSGQRFQWKPIAAVGAGIAVGVALHPNAANLLQLNWVQMGVLLDNAWKGKQGFDLGSEFLPPPATIWVTRLLFAVAIALSSIVVAVRQEKKDPIVVAFGIAAIGFCILTTRTMRFVEYFVPFSIAALALGCRPVRWRFVPQALLCVGLIYFLSFGYEAIARMTRRGNDMPQELAQALQQVVPPGAQVFNADWRETGPFMLALPGRKFIVALDPTFFYANDKERYRLWFDLCRQAPPETKNIILRSFGARYVLFFTTPQFAPLDQRLSSDPGVRLLLRTRILALFDLLPGGMNPLGGSAPNVQR